MALNLLKDPESKKSALETALEKLDAIRTRLQSDSELYEEEIGHIDYWTDTLRHKAAFYGIILD